MGGCGPPKPSNGPLFVFVVPGRIVIAFVAKLMLYGFRPDKGRFTELLRILEKDWEDEGATGYGGVPQPVAHGRDR